MDIHSGKRAIEQPKTLREAKARAIADLELRRVALKGQAEAVRMVLGNDSPIAEWIDRARESISAALLEFNR